MVKRALIFAVILGGLCGVGAARAGSMPAAVDNPLLQEIFKAPSPAAPALSPLQGSQAAGSCQTFKWDRACSSTSQQECQASCGTCTMCLDVVQFYPCVYECSCTC